MKFTLIEKRDEAKGTKSFIWEPEKALDYLPGQYFYFTLWELNYPDPRGATRHFTLSSSPTETPLISLTTRIREQSGYKKTLDELAIGSVVDGEGPNGTFILDPTPQELRGASENIFVAGGIGITPFRSMIKYAIDKNLDIPIHLIYSNSLPEEITFRAELEEWSKKFPNFKLDMTVTKPEESKEKWTGTVGRIDENLLKKLITNDQLLIANYWLCGPPPMVDGLEQVLGKLGLSVGRVRSEKFTGY